MADDDFRRRGQKDRDPIANPDSVAPQGFRQPVGPVPQRTVTGDERPAGNVLDDRGACRISGRPPVADIDTDVVAGRNVPFERLKQPVVIANVGQHGISK
jgi:hypothetical protein